MEWRQQRQREQQEKEKQKMAPAEDLQSPQVQFCLTEKQHCFILLTIFTDFLSIIFSDASYNSAST